MSDALETAEGAGATSGRSGAGEREASDLLRRRLITVERLVPAVLVGDDPDDVHDLRVASRRLQQALDALFAKPRSAPLRAIRRRLRRLRRALGEWRNADVLLALSEERRRRSRNAARRDAYGLLEAHLVDKRRREIRRARRRILRLDLGSLAGDVEPLLEPSSTQTSEKLRDRLAEGIAETWEDWQTALRKAEREPRSDEVHALRIAGKRLRYRIELVVELGDETRKPLLSWLKEIQEHLGDWHDRQVLHIAMAEAFSHPSVFLRSAAAVRAALTEIEADRGRDDADLRAVFEQSIHPPLAVS